MKKVESEKAQEHYTLMMKWEMLASQLAEEITPCREGSMTILGEFEQLAEGHIATTTLGFSPF